MVQDMKMKMAGFWSEHPIQRQKYPSELKVQRKRVLRDSKINFKKIFFDTKICKISIVGVGMKSNVGVAQVMFEPLAKKNINIKVISTSEIKISVLIESHKKKIALNSLHKAYGLGS